MRLGSGDKGGGFGIFFNNFCLECVCFVWELILCVVGLGVFKLGLFDWCEILILVYEDGGVSKFGLIF